MEMQLTDITRFREIAAVGLHLLNWTEILILVDEFILMIDSTWILALQMK